MKTMDKINFGKILIISSAFIISGANASIQKVDDDKMIVKDRKMTTGQALRDLGIDTKGMNKVDKKKTRENLNYLKSLGYNLKNLAMQNKLRSYLVTLEGLQMTSNKAVTKSEIDNLINRFAREEANLDKPTMNSDTKQPRKKFGHRVKKLGKDIKEKVEKVTKSPKAREIRNEMKDGVKKGVKKVEKVTREIRNEVKDGVKKVEKVTREIRNEVKNGVRKGAEKLKKTKEKIIKK